MFLIKASKCSDEIGLMWVNTDILCALFFQLLESSNHQQFCVFKSFKSCHWQLCKKHATMWIYNNQLDCIQISVK